MTESEIKPTIGAVMVLYAPDLDVTDKAIEAILPQVDLLCIVDNTPGADLSARFTDNRIHYIAMSGNSGIAAAQNRGTRWLLDRGVDFLVYTDQDSETRPDTIARLMKGYNILTDGGVKVGLAGTLPVNRDTGEPYRLSARRIDTSDDLRRIPGAEGISEYYSAISSISLIPRRAMLDNGGFDESLFIDGVDHEWCWRAWHTHAYRTFIVRDAVIDHCLGQGDRHLAARQVHIASADRVYYQFRNYLWLKRLEYTPAYWIKKNGMKYAVKFFYFPIMVSPRGKYLKNILRGIRDGLRRRHPDGSFPRF